MKAFYSRMLLILFVTVCCANIYAANGDKFTSNTIEGVPMTFTILDETAKTCMAGTNVEYESAVPAATTGAVTIPAEANAYKVVAVGSHAIYKTNVEYISISEGVESINDNAFSGNESLKSLIIPSTVSSLGKYILMASNSVERVISYIEEPFDIPSSVFMTVYVESDPTYGTTYSPQNLRATLYVPSGKKSAYLSAEGWKLFTTIEELDENAEEFTSLGFGTLTDNFFDGSATVEILQSEDASYKFRIMRPYDGITNTGGSAYKGSDYMDIYVMTAGNRLDDVTLTRSGLVYFTNVNTGYYHSSYSDYIWAIHPHSFTGLNTEDKWLYNGVVDYQDQYNTLPAEVQLAPFYYIFNVGGWNNTQYSNVVRIKFPDYSVHVEKGDVTVDNNGQEYQSVHFELGENVEYIKYAVTTGNVNDMFDAIFAGTADTQVARTSGTVHIPLNNTGIYKLVVVAYGGGKSRLGHTSYLCFKSPKDSQLSYKDVGSGTYYAISSYRDGSTMSDITISQCTNDENLYRLAWNDSEGMQFRWNKTDNTVQVERQFTGYSSETYGDVLVSDMPTWSDDYNYSNAPSYYDPSTKTFHFNVAYYAERGYFGYGEETFVANETFTGEPDNPVGIAEISSDTKITPAYSLSGQRLTAPRKGVNIVGSRKVVVK